MPISAAEGFRAWHDFYILAGTAAGALIGAMFVVASIGSSHLTREHGPQISTYLTPTVIHLSTVVFASALALIPTLEWQPLALVCGGAGLAGMIYSSVIGWRIARRREVDWADQAWYALLPILAYGIILASAMTVLLHSTPSLDAFAGGLALLVVASLRNAWDMIIYFATRPGHGPQ
ncbi:MAG TPA: hypothetical protein VHW90_11575 [Stellaceae bacterium]|jgi:hypothetical protein|nr:hypothetical protein [Stellaceae bacterium]